MVLKGNLGNYKRSSNLEEKTKQDFKEKLRLTRGEQGAIGGGQCRKNFAKNTEYKRLEANKERT